MIKNILLNRIATYTEPVEIQPSAINYIYGGNGSGKTTLSNIIADEGFSEDSKILWLNKPVETLVYNKKFVDENFGQSKSIRGIFTLGKNSVEAQSQINILRERLDYINKQLVGLSKRYQEINNNIEGKEIETIDKCWAVKTTYDNLFRPAYTGVVGKKKDFFNKCVSELSINHEPLLKVDDIINKSKKIFSQTLKLEGTISQFNFESSFETEDADILSLSIIGKQDAPIGKLIHKLKNSDWVKQGLEHLEYSDEKCPFCQKDVEHSFRQELEDFFDESYMQDCNRLASFKKRYQYYFESKIEELREIPKKQINLIDNDLLVSKVKLAQEIYKQNVKLIDNKIVSPSLKIKLETLVPYFEEIKFVVDEYVTKINNNNAIVNNLKFEQEDLKKKIWRFTIDLLKADLDSYLESVDKLIRAKQTIAGKIGELEAERNGIESQIKGWESEVTNVHHTINEINKILGLFSFNSFRLAEANEIGFYRIVREDGSEGHETLSEGEYRFITFLYFYQLLKGNTSSTGITRDKVVVFDDPISSLDSSVLFVVSNLVKEVIKSCKEGTDGIRQVFILTHNIYFHKEVTFKGARQKSKWAEETYWIIKKLDKKSKIILHTENPIKTSYELLWRELAEPDQINKVTIFNTLRRILEYYFNIIGGLDYEVCINSFEGEEKIICKSLVSWINDGSHFINDDLIFHTDDEAVLKYLRVFKLIFEKMDHISHYNMMVASYNPTTPVLESV